jgi:hypothetical protein
MSCDTIQLTDLFCKNCEFCWLEYAEPEFTPIVNEECQLCIAEKNWFHIFVQSRKDEINRVCILNAVRFKHLWLPVRRRRKYCCFCKNQNQISTCRDCLLPYYAFAGFPQHIMCVNCYENTHFPCEPCNCEQSCSNLSNHNWV